MQPNLDILEFDFNSPLFYLRIPYFSVTVNPTGMLLLNAPIGFSGHFPFCLQTFKVDVTNTRKGKTFYLLACLEQSAIYTRYFDFDTATFSDWYSISPVGALHYKGTWDASTNTPHLQNGFGQSEVGDLYYCIVAGTVDFGAGPISFQVGDSVAYNGFIWQNIGNIFGINDITSNNNSITISRNGENINIEVNASSDVNPVNAFDYNIIYQNFNANFSIDVVRMPLGLSYHILADSNNPSKITMSVSNGTFKGFNALGNSTMQQLNPNDSFIITKVSSNLVFIN